MTAARGGEPSAIYMLWGVLSVVREEPEKYRGGSSVFRE